MLWYRALFCDTQEEIEPFGADPPGFMILGTNGRVMFLFMSKERPMPHGDADKARLLDTLTAYTGRMRVDGSGRITTTVDLAWHPAFGGEQTRFFRLEGERLRIWTPEQTHPRFGDRRVVMSIEWIREGEQVGQT